MTKYYRVRSQEQWDWLANKLNIYCVKSMGCPVIIEHEQGQKYYQVIQYHGGSEPVIEVSKLMEDEKMENIDAYQEVAKNYPLSADDVRDILYHHVFSGSTLKIKMTEAEKDEFDKLNKEWTTLYSAISAITNEFLEYPLLNNRLFIRMTSAEENEAQIEFARAWADFSLIEVIKEPKYNVKVPNTKDCLYYKINNSVRAGVPQRRPSRFKFTASELKEYGLDDDMFEKIEVQE